MQQKGRKEDVTEKEEEGGNKNWRGRGGRGGAEGCNKKGTGEREDVTKRGREEGCDKKGREGRGKKQGREELCNKKGGKDV